MEAGEKQTRFAGTPPDSPRSCMKGSRRINFAEPDDKSSSKESSSIASGPSFSPKKSAKFVSVKTSADASEITEPSGPSMKNASFSEPSKPQSDIQFQFHLSQHYEQSTPPPNCTSNGDSHYNYDDETTAKKVMDPKYSAVDPQLMEIASRFVNEIIETAKIEATNRQQQQQQQGPGSSSTGDGRSIPAFATAASFRAVAEDFLSGTRPWYRRAHGAISKWITNLCVRAQTTMRT